jgi:hypothetical protein
VSVVSASLPTDSDGALAVGGVTAVENLALDESGSAPAWYSLSLDVFVYGTLTVRGNASAPTPATVTTLKNVVIEDSATADTTIETLSDDAQVDVSPATIALNQNNRVKVEPPAALSSPAFSVTGEQGVQEVSGSTTVNARITANNGLVEFTEDVTQATITGTEKVKFSGDTTGFTTADITARAIEFSGEFSATGAVTLNGAVSFGEDVTFGETASFGGDVTVTDAAALTLIVVPLK